MFCPKCKDEFVPGIKECVDCNVPLVEKLSESHGTEPNNTELNNTELVTVLVTLDMGELLIAKSVLESEGIRYLAKGEGLQFYFGQGSIGAGYLMAPVELQVSASDAEDAKAMLSGI
jgi:hypothetical protein